MSRPSPAREPARPPALRCPLCSGPGDRLEGPEYRECARLHGAVLFAWPWESGAEYARWYAEGEFHGPQQAAEGFRPYGDAARETEFRRAAVVRLWLLRQWVPDGRLLDVGCGTGALVRLAREWGYDAAGLDPCPRFAGGDVRAGSWWDADGAWDLVTLCDVLEHVTEPLSCLRHLAGLLAPEGLLYVEMPEAYAPRGDWRRHLRPRQHVALYSEGAARELFHRAGLVPVLMLRPLRGALAKAGWLLARADA